MRGAQKASILVVIDTILFQTRPQGFAIRKRELLTFHLLYVLYFILIEDLSLGQCINLLTSM